jgi:ABC-type multidrug transport system ATPase subunit
LLLAHLGVALVLLELDSVVKSYRGGSVVALDGVSLSVDAGEMVVVWGERLSGRSTLLRIAAGVEAPDSGEVRFDGRSLPRRDGTAPIRFVRRRLLSRWGPTVIDELIGIGLSALNLKRPLALRQAHAALLRVDGEGLAGREPRQLKSDELMRVVIARALLCGPRLLVVDEPTLGIDPLKRDSILELLSSLAADGVAVFASAGDGTGLLGADRVLMLENGKIEGEAEPRMASVQELDQHRHKRTG